MSKNFLKEKWNPMKIAIVGSGISGLTAGYLLAPLHEVHLFESEERLGGHTHTHSIEVASGSYNIDTGFIVFNDRNYPNFTKLMNQLKIESQPSSMSFSVKSPHYNLEYNGTTLNSLFCQRRNLLRPSFYRMIKDIIRFNKEATNYFLVHKEDPQDGVTLESYLEKNNYSQEFTEHYIMPMGAAIWSASREEMRQFPLHFFVRFFHHHGMLTVDDRPQWRVLKGGSSSYLSKITERFKNNIHLGKPVVSVIREEKSIRLKTVDQEFEFDHVIFASHADQAMKIFSNPTEIEKEIMNGFAYRPNDILLHTDLSVLPKRKLGHAAWNYYLPEKLKERVAVTYHMNILQGIKSPETFLVSLNMDEYIDPKKVIKEIKYSHPVYNLGAVKSQKRWSEISGRDRIHFCGAYWASGFHEDGVKSGLRVAQMLGGDL
jgi:predicted NAD/FAD-binding protein